VSCAPCGKPTPSTATKPAAANAAIAIHRPRPFVQAVYPARCPAHGSAVLPGAGHQGRAIAGGMARAAGVLPATRKALSGGSRGSSWFVGGSRGAHGAHMGRTWAWSMHMALHVALARGPGTRSWHMVLAHGPGTWSWHVVYAFACQARSQLSNFAPESKLALTSLGSHPWARIPGSWDRFGAATLRHRSPRQHRSFPLTNG
jgi:hypothetical protein